MVYTVETEIPAQLREQVGATFKQIGQVASTLPESTALWRSLSDSVLQLELGGYRFWYRVDRRDNIIVVVHIDDLERPNAA